MVIRFPALLLAAATLICAQDEIRLTQVASGMPLITDIQSARDGTGRLFVAQQGGVIRIVQNGAVLPAPFLDLSGRTQGGGERGLLGLAFAPGYAQNGRFYVDYTRAVGGATVIARYRVSANPNTAEADSEQVILTVAQPAPNHNAGQLAFGPDGYLYAGMGDGGGGGDPQNNGQSGLSLLGKMLRLDVESDPNGTYRVPADNPFVGNPAYQPEIWALGLRNPWRYSFDRETGDLWIADVGQNRAEEVNFQPASSGGGENYGWRIMEGLQCYPPGANCNQTGLTLPIHEYTRGAGDLSITGGYVYRGASSPSLRGAYIYGDYASGRIWGLLRVGVRFENRFLLRAPFSISTFGEDEDGELYVANHGQGILYRIEGLRALSFTAAAVGNAASFEPGLVAGSAATAFVAGITDGPGIAAAERIPLPAEIAAVRVLVNDLAAPLYAVANVNGMEQVNFQVPFEAANAGEVRVVVQRGGASSSGVAVPLLPRQPGVFTDDGRAVVVRNATNTLVTGDNPVAAGEDIYFYVAGLGGVTNVPPTGGASPREPLARAVETPTVTIGGVECTVQFAGLAPDLVGVFQVNVRVAQGITAGLAELVVTAGGVSSPAALVPVR